jgi:hypothetical protein
MFAVIQTPSFLRSMATIWSEGEVIDFISANPLAGDVIPGTQSLRKVRWSRAGMGKFDNLPTEFLNRLKETYDV